MIGIIKVLAAFIAAALAVNALNLDEGGPSIPAGLPSMDELAAAVPDAPTASSNWSGDLADCGVTDPQRYSLDQVASVAASTGLRGEDLATAIAIAGWAGSPNPAESCHGQVCAQGDKTPRYTDGKWGNSMGLWQVRSLDAKTGTGHHRDGSRLCDPTFNAQAMLAVYHEQGWGAWSVYTKGYHQSNMAQARTAAGSFG